MSTSCSGLVRSYVACLRETPCMKVRTAVVAAAVAAPLYLAPQLSPLPLPPLLAQEQHRSVTECAATRPDECEALRYALFTCRRGQVDARTRIQGNKGY
jgi:cytochrome c oxidase assembly factor 5